MLHIQFFMCDSLDSSGWFIMGIWFDFSGGYYLGLQIIFDLIFIFSNEIIRWWDNVALARGAHISKIEIIRRATHGIYSLFTEVIINFHTCKGGTALFRCFFINSLIFELKLHVTIRLWRSREVPILTSTLVIAQTQTSILSLRGTDNWLADIREARRGTPTTR